MATRPVTASFVYSESDDEDDVALHEQASALFQARKIRLHRAYDGFLVITERDRVIAAAALAPDLGRNEVEFSVAVAPDRERRGLARLLVGEVIKWSKRHMDDADADHVDVTAEVVNDAAMIPLLTVLGFEDLGQRMWSLHVPLR